MFEGPKYPKRVSPCSPAILFFFPADSEELKGQDEISRSGMREGLFSPFGNLHARSCAIDSGPWGNNTHCFNNKGSRTRLTGKYYQDSDGEDRQGLTMGSMWYDGQTNGSWAVGAHPVAAMAHAFH
jgi:hypothetical protein